eukprot:c6668_g1_i2.p1 GENE.c6668_g1_i2~~c6668_g1_i2.p1  ORF type:complete len:772 (-),score=118.69 c6668_g1_i2:161-2293(-)
MRKWQWQKDNFNWVDFHVEHSDLLNTALDFEQFQLIISVNGVNYQLNLSQMTQTNPTTRKIRRIRYVDTDEGVGLHPEITAPSPTHNSSNNNHYRGDDGDVSTDAADTQEEPQHQATTGADENQFLGFLGDENADFISPNTLPISTNAITSELPVSERTWLDSMYDLTKTLCCDDMSTLCAGLMEMVDGAMGQISDSSETFPELHHQFVRDSIASSMLPATSSSTSDSSYLHKPHFAYLSHTNWEQAVDAGTERILMQPYPHPLPTLAVWSWLSNQQHQQQSSVSETNDKIDFAEMADADIPTEQASASTSTNHKIDQSVSVILVTVHPHPTLAMPFPHIILSLPTKGSLCWQANSACLTLCPSLPLFRANLLRFVPPQSEGSLCLEMRTSMSPPANVVDQNQQPGQSLKRPRDENFVGSDNNGTGNSSVGTENVHKEKNQQKSKKRRVVVKTDSQLARDLFAEERATVIRDAELDKQSGQLAHKIANSNAYDRVQLFAPGQLGTTAEDQLNDANQVDTDVGDGNASAPEITCTICFEPVKQLFPLACRHTACRECLATYVFGEIAERRVPVKCPMPNCGVELTQEDCQDLATAKDFDKMQRFLLEGVVMKNPEQFCCCPTPGCDNIFAQDSSTPDFVCDKCQKRYCLRCRVDWHSGVSCEDYQKWLVENGKGDQGFNEYVSGMRLKQCPMCKFWVEKSMGCDHMTCRCG